MIQTKLRSGVIAALCRAEDEAQPVWAGSAGQPVALSGMTGDVSCGLLPRRCARHRFLPAAEDLDDAHGAAAAGAWFAQGEWGDLGLCFGRGDLFGLLDAEQGADLGDVGLAGRAGQQAVMPDAVEAIGQDMDQEPANELGRGQPHDLLPVARLDPVILPAEGDGMGIGADQARVRDGDPVGIAAQIGQHRLWPAEGRFGIDHPFGFAERGEPGGERLGVCQLGQIAEEGQLTGPVQIPQPLQKQAPEQPRQHPHMQEEPGAAGNPPVPSGDRPPPGTIMWMWG